MNSKNFVLPVIALVLAIASCSKKPDIENTSTYKMAGEWFTQYYEGGAVIPIGHNKILTYNTSDPNSNQIWVEDPNVWTFKSKFNINYNDLSFAATNDAQNTDDPSETIKLIEGKIIPGGGLSKSGNVVDSIYLKLEFSTDPGTVYEIRGHGRTGFFEDEY